MCGRGEYNTDKLEQVARAIFNQQNGELLRDILLDVGFENLLNLSVLVPLTCI